MDQSYFLYGLLGVILATMLILSMLKPFYYKHLIIAVLFLGFLISSFYTIIAILSNPRPVSLMLPYTRPNPKEADLMAVYMVENKYIMLLLYWEGLDHPQYFKFDWNKKMAEDVQQAKNNSAKGTGDKKVIINYPFDNSLDRRRNPWAYAKPQQSSGPGKQKPTNKIIRFKRN